jgi:hypothetical protein
MPLLQALLTQELLWDNFQAGYAETNWIVAEEEKIGCVLGSHFVEHGGIGAIDDLGAEPASFTLQLEVFQAR